MITAHIEEFPGGLCCLVPNKITTRETNFYVSVNSHDQHIYGDITTALVVNDGKSERFYILNGNHAAQYAELSPNLGACLAYFAANTDIANKYSDKLH